MDPIKEEAVSHIEEDNASVIESNISIAGIHKPEFTKRNGKITIGEAIDRIDTAQILDWLNIILIALYIIFIIVCILISVKKLICDRIVIKCHK